MKTIDQLMKDRNNNYDIIRLIAAILVIFSHSFPLSSGYINGEDPDPLQVMTGGIAFGKIAVIIFFVISGFLITQSFDRSKRPLFFLKARILRIFPALIFVVLLTAFVLGPLVTNLNFGTYISSTSTFAYLKNISLQIMVYPLPGVFEQNAYPDAVNGSLWTLVYEFKCYIGVMVLGILRLLRKDVVLFLFLASSVLYVTGHGGLDAEMLSYFSVGMVFYLYRDKIKLNNYAAAGCALLSVLTLLLYDLLLQPLFVVALSYTLMCLVYNTKTKINGSKFGDLSYGTYIFAFPIQQAVTFFFGGSMDWWMNLIVSLPITLAMSALSWHLIEKNALKYKNFSFRSRVDGKAAQSIRG